MWIDAHAHIQFDDLGMAALDRAIGAGVDHLVCVGTDAATSKDAVELAEQRPERISATVGLHPHDAKQGLDSTIAVLENALAIENHQVVGIGECGLDYFYEHSSKNVQREIFAQQIELAKRYDLALVVHTRDAWNDTWEILRSEGAPPRTVIHCFTGGAEEARKCLDLGFYLSFSGIVTFKKAIEVQAAAEICPLDRMTIETDSPFLAPIPHRGKPNEPALVGVIGSYLADMKKLQVEEFAASVSKNTKELFNLR